MRRLAVLVALVVILAGLVLSGISEGSPSIADTSSPNNEVTSSVNQTDSPLSANATITIIMTTPPLPEASVDLETQSKGG